MNNCFGNTTMQLSLRMPQSKADGEWEIVSGAADRPTEVQQRVEVIQQLMAARGTKHYAKVQHQAAQRLGISVRSLRRWERNKSGCFVV
jgi:putative transposase